MSYRPSWLTFGRYAAVTTAMTTILVALGVYTSGTGSGLACQAQWPLCSDQLIPTLTINPDFIEWFHRVWAMVTGFLIIGLAGWTWIDDVPRRTRIAATLAVVILPVQILVGAVTVTIGGLVPGGYTVSTHAAHLIVALLIVTLLGVVLLGRDGPGAKRDGPERLRIAAGIGIGGILLGALFSRAVPLVTYSPGAQAAFYLWSLVGFLGLLALALRTPATTIADQTARRVRTLAAVALAALFVTLLLGRDLVIYPGFWEGVNRLLLAVVVVATAAAGWTLARADRPPESESGSVGGAASRGE
ncbi:cytochrome c oxidase assembly protein subunit 15 [Halopenitus malekzadehii]|uniref:Cytochrome c oxidase assembly protein subunit 15 n=1 Tax=Halopenitus malekzadehii TaxID=1267564 RepID=A0A1H6ITT4_9EURY|nr:COX15/CtaA family protein [Halopenitus malekzadehii]SEH49886.1 cytochrome c oxidase assembly protein subunit 15 [Halopenitus malekzadehii]